MSDTAENKRLWNSLEITKIAVGALTPLLIFVIGIVVNQSIRSRDQADQRQAAVQTLSRFIYERRARSEMLASGIRRAAAKEELEERKRLYDEAYVQWNTNHQANLLQIRRLLNEKQYSDFEALMEFQLVTRIFKPLDECLTSAYDNHRSGTLGATTLDQCGARELIQRALDCGYAFTDELFKLSADDTLAGRDIASQEIIRRCGSPSAADAARGR